MTLPKAQRLENTFNKLLNTIDDLQVLEPNLFSQVGQIQSYVLDIKDTVGEINREKQPESTALEIIKKSVEATFFNELSNVNIQNLNINFIGNSNIEFLCKFKNQVSSLVNVLNIFTISGPVDITFSENHVYTSFFVNDVKADLNSKSKLKDITNYFFTQELLLTFETVSVPKKGQLMVLDLDFCYDGEQFCIHRLNDKVKLTLPRFIESYEVKVKEDLPESKHLVIELTKDITLKLASRLPDYLDDSLTDVNHKTKYCLYHFPFLFRPISIIIPNEDIDSTLGSTTKSERTGSVMAKPKTLRGEVLSGHIDFFDFFKE